MARTTKKVASKKKATKPKSPVKRKTPAKKPAPVKKTPTKRASVKKSSAKKSPAKKSGKGSGLSKNYPLSKELQAIVGKSKSNLSEVNKLVWVYIKAKKLQDKKDGRMVNPDAKLAKVLGKKKLSMFQFGGKLSAHVITKSTK